jgi:hypothetical protein
MAVPIPPRIRGLSYVKDLGSGGFADVYLYRDESLGRLVAVKVPRPELVDDEWLTVLWREARIMAGLRHPNIGRVYSVGLSLDDRPYVEMAYFPNESLAKAARRAPLRVADVLRIGVQLSGAVETAHRAGLLHRDIKPGNILMNQFGDIALTDFGIAAPAHSIDDGSDTHLSVPWAPPEVIFLTSPADVRSDVYSLAATLWTLLAGHSPYEPPGSDNRIQALALRVRDWAPPPTGRPDVPASLEALLAQGLAKDPSRRPPTAAEFGRRLQAIEEELHLAVTPFQAQGEGAADATTTRTVSFPRPDPPKSRRTFRGLVVVVVALTLVAAGLGLALWRVASEPNPVATTTVTATATEPPPGPLETVGPGEVATSGVWVWGWPGITGDGTFRGTSVLTQVPGLERIVDVTIACRSVIAMDGSGAVWAWGANDCGEAGLVDGVPGHVLEPVRLPMPAWPELDCCGMLAVEGGTTAAFAIASMYGHNEVYGWGDGEALGHLGLTGPQTYQRIGYPTELIDIVAIDASTGGAALDSDGQVWRWGATEPSSYVTPPEPTQVEGLEDVIAIAVDRRVALAVTADGAVWSWGQATPGYGDSLGNPFFTIEGLPPAAAAETDGSTVWVIAQDGTLWAFGDNDRGQFGDGTRTSSATPVQVPGIEKAATVRAWNGGVWVIGQDGSLWSWGSSDGTGAEADQLAPHRVTAVEKALDIAVGEFGGVVLVA